MDTGKTTTLIISLVVGVVLIAGVMTPILQSMIGSGGNDGSDDSETTGGFAMRDFNTAVETYDLIYMSPNDGGYMSKNIIMKPISNELHWQLVTIQLDDNYDEISRNVETDVVMEDCILFMGWTHLYAYIGGNIIYDGDYDGSQTEPESTPLSEIESITISANREEGYDPSYWINIIAEGGSTVAAVASNVDDTSTPAFVADPNGTHIGYAGNDLSFYFSEDIYCGYIEDEKMLAYFGSNAYYGIMTDPSGEFTTVNPIDMTLVNPFESETSEYHHIEGTSADTNLSLNYTYSGYDEEEGGIVLDATQVCNVYIIPIDPNSPGNSSGGGSGVGVDGTLASLISIIPLLMTVGLVIATISVMKRQ